jgi:hypothetical protein
MNDFGLVDSDIELLRAARTDPDAFGDFYHRHAVAVERWIRARKSLRTPTTPIPSTEQGTTP